MQSHNIDDVRDNFRQQVLAALDDVAKMYLGQGKQGWTDSDLPTLFKALDAHIERWAERNDVALLEPVESA